MNNGKKRKQRPRTSTAEKNAFTPGQEEALRVAADALREGIPWMHAKPEARLVAYRATFPRSIAGDKQDDQLLRRIWVITQMPSDDVGLTRLAIVETLNVGVARQDPKEEALITKELGKDEPPGSVYRMVDELAKMVSELRNLSRVQSFEPETDAEFFSRIARGLNYLDTYKPTLGDFAVEALQNAFVGLMREKYAWGKKGLPTKGDVEKMAKAFLEEDGKPIRKSGWTDLLRSAGLDFLPEGAAGRPSKPEVAKARKLQQQTNSTITQIINAYHGGDRERFLARLKASLGGKKLFEQRQTDERDDEIHRAPWKVPYVAGEEEGEELE